MTSHWLSIKKGDNAYLQDVLDGDDDSWIVSTFDSVLKNYVPSPDRDHIATIRGPSFFLALFVVFSY